MLRKVVIALMLLVMVVFSSGCAQKDVDQPEKTRAFVQDAMHEAIALNQVKSASIAIMNQGNIVLSEGFGMADFEQHEETSHETIFNIGSISKLFVTASVLMLVDQNKLNLNDYVYEHLEAFTMKDERYKDITVQMLLNHSSGLPGFTLWNNFGYAVNHHVYDELFEVLSMSGLKHQPGAYMPYCNDGFTLAEILVAEISGMSYSEFVTKNIFEPLNMNNAYPGLQHVEDHKSIARYMNDKDQVEPLEIVSLLGSGGLASTPNDLNLFIHELIHGSMLLSESSKSILLEAQSADFQNALEGDVHTFGLGWDFADIPAFTEDSLRLYGKSGGTGHYNTMLFTIPSVDISVSLFVTGGQLDVRKLTYEILSTYLDELGLVTLEDMDNTIIPRDAMSFEERIRYAGYYSMGASTLQVEFDEAGNMLFYIVVGNESHFYMELPYLEGYFWHGDTKYYFVTFNEHHHLMTYLFDYGRPFFPYIAADKLYPPSNPVTLDLDLSEEQTIWLRKNSFLYESTAFLSMHVLTMRWNDNLPGLIDFYGFKHIVSPNEATMTAKGIRDLFELRLFEVHDQPWIWLSGGLYSSLDEAIQLSSGITEITIGNEAYSEWLILEEDLTLSFEHTRQTRIIIFTHEGILYDTLLDEGDVFVQTGSLIQIMGKQGEVIIITQPFIE